MGALIVAMAGTGYAAITLPKNSVGTKQIKNGQVKTADLANNAVTGAKIKDGTLTATDFRPGQLVAGAPGPAGPAGPKGATGAAGTDGANGAPATRLFAAVDGGAPAATTAPVLLHGSGVTGVVRRNGTDQGRYIVDFNQDVSSCVPVVSITAAPGPPGAPGFALAGPTGSPGGTQMFVRTSNVNSPDTNLNFSLAVFC